MLNWKSKQKAAVTALLVVASFLLMSLLEAFAPGLRSNSLLVLNPLYALDGGPVRLLLVLVWPVVSAIAVFVKRDPEYGILTVFSLVFGGLLFEYWSESLCCAQTYVLFRIQDVHDVTFLVMITGFVFLGAVAIAVAMGSLGALPTWYVIERKRTI